MDCSSLPTAQNGGDLLWVTQTWVDYGIGTYCASGNGPNISPPSLSFGPSGYVAVAKTCDTLSGSAFPAESLDGFGANLQSATASLGVHDLVFAVPTPGMPSCGDLCVGQSGSVLSFMLGAKGADATVDIAIKGPSVSTKVDNIYTETTNPEPMPIEGVNVDAVGNVFLVFHDDLMHGGDVHLTRIDASGNSSTLPSFTGLYVPDRTGGVLRFGALSAGQDVGCGPMTPSSSSSYYLARLGASWGCVFGKVLSGPASVQADPNGGAVVSATTSASADFGCGSTAPAPGGGTTLARLDPSGSCIFGRAIGAPNLSVVTDMGNTLLFGSAPAGSVNLGGGSLAPIGTGDLLMVQLDAQGNHVWSKRIGAAGATWASAQVSIATSGDVYVLARYSGSVDFGGGPITAASGDVVVASFTPAGAHRWSHGYSFNKSYAAGIDACGSLVVATADPAFDLGNGPVLPSSLSMTAPPVNIAVIRYAP